MRRRVFSREFKVSAVGLVQQRGYSVAQAARNLGVDPSTLRGWAKQFKLDDGQDPTERELAEHSEKSRTTGS